MQSLQLSPDETFGVVLLLGLVYHLEDPTGAIRRARAAEQAPGSFATRVEPDTAENPISSSAGVLSLIPNRVALEQMVRAAGFSELEFLVARPDHNPQYVRGDRAVLLARP